MVQFYIILYIHIWHIFNFICIFIGIHIVCDSGNNSTNINLVVAFLCVQISQRSWTWTYVVSKFSLVCFWPRSIGGKVDVLFFEWKPLWNLMNHLRIYSPDSHAADPGNSLLGTSNHISPTKSRHQLDKDDLNRTYLTVRYLEGTLWKINGWNLQITHLERKTIFQTPMIMFHVNLPGCMCFAHLFSKHQTSPAFAFAKSFRFPRWKVPWIPPISMTSVVLTSDSPFIRKDTRRVGVGWCVG